VPREVKSVDEFLRLAEKAEVCRVKRLGEVVKLKLRGRRYLYTLALKASEAEAVLKKLKCEIVEL